MHLKLKEFFEKKGVSQTQLAEILDVSPPYINAILNGKKPIGKKNAERLIKDNGPIICYGIGIGVGVLASIVIIGPAAKAQALKDIRTSTDNLIDFLINPKEGGILMQLTKHSVAGNIDVSAALTPDTARGIANDLHKAADIVDEGIKVVNF